MEVNRQQKQKALAQTLGVVSKKYSGRTLTGTKSAEGDRPLRQSGQAEYRTLEFLAGDDPFAVKLRRQHPTSAIP